MRRLLCLTFVFGLLSVSPLAAYETLSVSRLPQIDEPAPLRMADDQVTPASWSADVAEKDELGQTEYYSYEQLQQMMTATAKANAWRKGDFTITPYGFLWGNMVYETEQSYPGSYALFIRSAELYGDDDFCIDARSTRLGIDIAGPRLWCFNCAQSGGKVEFDFQGAFVTENKSGVLLRHAYWEVKNEDFRLLMGQTWDVISPLYPNTIMYSVYWGAGNIGYRRPQLRYERYLHFSPVSMVTLQGSMNLSIVSDFTGANDGIEGNHGGWPVLEGRAAWTLGCRGKGCQPIVVGASGHIGNQEFNFGPLSPLPGEYVRPTWSVNADFHVPITNRFGVHGEFFTGENLGTFLGGIIQGVDINTAQPIRSTGGWFEFWYDWSCRWHTNAGFTIDDPFNEDITTAAGRTYNSAYYVNLVHDVTKQFKMGFEVSSWKTLYKGLEPGESVRFEFMAKYGF